MRAGIKSHLFSIKSIAYATIFIGLGILAAYIFLLFYHKLINVNWTLSLENSDHIGSFIGGTVGIFFSLGSLLLVLATLQQQNAESSKQEKINNYIAFDSSFFKLLSVHQDLKGSIEGTVNTSEVMMRRLQGDTDSIMSRGIDFFDNLCIAIAERCETHKIVSISQQVDIYIHFFNEHVVDIAHYFRNLFLLLTYIDRSSAIKEPEKKFYMRIIRSQLSQSEIIIIGYNGLTEFGKEFGILINEYNFLENIHFDFYANTTHKYFYNQKLLADSYPHLQKLYNLHKQKFDNGERKFVPLADL